jgi:hypothetical protein
VGLSATLLQGCNSNNYDIPTPAATPAVTYASLSNAAIVGSQRGSTPFISFVELRSDSFDNVADITYVIEAKPNAVSKPVTVQYSLRALKQRSYVGSADGVAILPVFGLYADYSNHVEVQLNFLDASTQTLSIDIVTTPYVDPRGVYDHVSILKSRSPQSTLSFDYFAMKSTVDSPVIVDTDGNVRWVAAVSFPSTSTEFRDNGFVIGDPTAPTLRRLELDGLVEQRPLIEPAYVNFHHNIEAGKRGMLVEPNEAVDQGSTLAEVTASGAVLKEWDFAAIIESYMYAQGDDASVRHQDRLRHGRHHLDLG